MSKEVFADAFGGLGISKGVVRIDLVTQSVTDKDAKGEPKDEFVQRVVMPVDGFLRSFSMMQAMMTKLQDAGLVKPREAGAPIKAPAKK